jgi:hypothetical protein
MTPDKTKTPSPELHFSGRGRGTEFLANLIEEMRKVPSGAARERKERLLDALIDDMVDGRVG